MRTPRLLTTLAAALALIPGGVFNPAGSQEYQEYEEYQEPSIEARVWLDRGNEPVLQRGEGVRVYYRTSQDAFVSIFHIDTNGTIRMVFPNSPQENHYARGGRDYRVLFPGSNYWYVDDDPGMGYFFIVASPEPFNFTDLRYSHYGGGWDLSYVGRQVYRDPYLAMDDYVAALIPDWEYIPYGLDFTAYNVEQRYDYPRFMCYECHGFRPYTTWNPYHYACTSFRLVIYNDPYYYPVTRYRGTRVVYVQPRRGLAHFGFKERAEGEAWTPQVVVRDTPPGRQPGVAGTAVRRPQGKEVPGAAASPPDRSGGSAPGARIPGVSGGTARRPTGSGSGVARPTSPPSAVNGGRGSGTARVPSGVTRTDPGRSGVTSPTAPGRPIVTPPSTGGSGSRPVVRTRPTTGSSGAGQATPPSSGRVNTRPSAKARGGGGSSAAASGGGNGGSGATARPTVRSGGAGSAVRPTIRSGGSGSAVRPPSGGGSTGSATRPPARSGSSGSAVRPTVRSGGSSAATRPTVRSGGSGSAVRPPARSGGSSARTVRPPARSGGSSAGTVRPPARSGGSSGATRSTVRSSGGTSRTPPARTSRPPTRKKKTGGGG